MSRLRWSRLLSLAVVAAMPLGALTPGCSSSKTSAAGQLISCKDTGAAVTDCHAVGSGSAGTGSDTCEDVDDDGDGAPHDEGEEHHGASHVGTAIDGDHGDGGDDDGDGVANSRDCDKRHGGDDDDSGDDDGSGSGDHDGSGSGSGDHDGSGHG
jgi:hypothetical protein